MTRTVQARPFSPLLITPRMWTRSKANLHQSLPLQQQQQQQQTAVTPMPPMPMAMPIPALVTPSSSAPALTLTPIPDPASAPKKITVSVSVCLCVLMVHCAIVCALVCVCVCVCVCVYVCVLRVIQQKSQREFPPPDMVESADMTRPHLAKRIISLGNLLIGAPFDDAAYINGENAKMTWFAIGKVPTNKDHMDKHTRTRTSPDNYYFVSTLSLSLSLSLSWLVFTLTVMFPVS